MLVEHVFDAGASLWERSAVRRQVEEGRTQLRGLQRWQAIRLFGYVTLVAAVTHGALLSLGDPLDSLLPSVILCAAGVALGVALMVAARPIAAAWRYRDGGRYPAAAVPPRPRVD